MILFLFGLVVGVILTFFVLFIVGPVIVALVAIAEEVKRSLHVRN